METAHVRSTSIWTRGQSICQEGHCTFISLLSKHKRVLVEENTKLFLFIDKKEIECLIDGTIANIKVLKIPQNPMASKDLDRQIEVEVGDEVVTFAMGHSPERDLILSEEILYIRVTRTDIQQAANSSKVDHPNSRKFKGKKRAPKDQEPDEHGPEEAKPENE